MIRVFLVGYMGVGKTTTGRELAKHLNLDFIDLDLFIQNRYNKAISTIFEEEGEIEFRKIENKVLKEVSDFENVVIATGGGAPCFYDNMDIMKKKGLTVYLKASPQMLADRLNGCKEKRPLIKDKNEKELLHYVTESLDKREDYYKQAQLIFETEELINKYDPDGYILLLVNKINSVQSNTIK